MNENSGYLTQRKGVWSFCTRILKRCVLALAALLALAVILCFEENWRGKREWESYRREWEARGEHFDFAGFVPPPVPDDQNLALKPIVASCYRRVMDGDGRHIEPENTNVVDRLTMEIHRQKAPVSTNMLLGSWQKSRLTNLKAWQDYYRAAFRTNEIPDRLNDGQPVTRVEVELLATNEFPTAPLPQSAAADVLLALSKYDAAIEELRQASRLPFARFPLNYTTNRGVMILPHYDSLKSTARALRLRAVAELNNGQAEDALADVQLILQLAGSIRNEPGILSSRVRMALVDYAIQPVWEGLAQRRMSEKQLAKLERELSGLEAISDYGRALRSDLAWMLKEIDYLRTERMANSITCMCGDPIFWPTLAYRISPNGWFYMNKVDLARCYQAALPTSTELSRRILSPDISRRFEATAGLVRGRSSKPANWLATFFLPSLEREAVNCARTQTSLDLARVACALELFRQASGSFPESLDNLVPTYMQEIPHDVVNGQSLHYHRTDPGNFRLYSVGWNGNDDDGKPETEKRFALGDSSGDWVWRYPEN